MKTARRLVPTLAVLALAACSGGASFPAVGRPAPSPASSAPPAQTSGSTRVEATIDIPISAKARSAAGKRGRKYVTPDTAGLVIEVDQITNGGTPVDYSDTGYDLILPTSTQSQTANCTEVTAVPVYQCTIVFNAPATDSMHSDQFQIFEYDSGESPGGGTNSAITNPSTFVPGGSLLGENAVGGNNAEQLVPSSLNPGGIPLNENSTLTVYLFPAIATPNVQVDGSTTSPLVLSVPGTGGTSDTAYIGGLDADGENIATYLSGTGDDSLYVNPPALASSAAKFGLNTSSASNLTAAPAYHVNEPVTVSYAPASGDQPTSSTATPPEGSFTVTTQIIDGGFHATTNFPIATETVDVAPLYGYSVETGEEGFTNGNLEFFYNVFALQAARPTGVTSSSYSLTPTAQSSTNDCSADTVAPLGTSGYQQAAYEIYVATSLVALPTLPPCTLNLSDSISTVQVEINPSGL